MAFAYNRIGRRVFTGGVVLEHYSYANSGGGTGGTITTKMNRVLFLKITEKDSSAMAAMATVNTTLPCGSAFVIVTTADKSGYVWVLGSSS